MLAHVSKAVAHNASEYIKGRRNWKISLQEKGQRQIELVRNVTIKRLLISISESSLMKDSNDKHRKGHWFNHVKLTLSMHYWISLIKV